MTTIELILAIGFWCSVGGVFYAYVGYPLIIYGLSRLFGKVQSSPSIQDIDLPRVALLIAAHNEAAVIEARIENALALDYPRDRLDIVIASDGSDDGTAEICRRYEPDVKLLDFTTRRGKAGTLNAAMTQLDAEIIVFSDANTFMDADSLRYLARWFADPGVGSVCGQLILTDSVTGRNVDGVYWRYETFLKRCEGRMNGLLGANGAIYAIRRELFVPLPPGTVVDDFVIPLSAKLKSGCRLIYDPQAIAREETASDISGEFRRRTRIGTGGFQALGILWPLLSPRHGWTAFTFWSHKVLRWICPFLLVGALAASSALIRHPLYAATFISQTVFYAVCALAAALPTGNRLCRILRISTMFAGMNIALLIGFFRWLVSNPTGIWNCTARISTGSEETPQSSISSATLSRKAA